MKPRHHVSRDAIELIKRFEGYRRVSARLADGRWTIGYGHIKTAREGAEVSEGDAEALLVYDLMEVTKAVNDLTYTPLTQNQFDALVCFAFNIGVENFQHSTVLRRVNEGAMLQAACAFEMWRKAEFEGERIVVDALVRRRAAEKALFLTPMDGWVPAPSSIVRPRVDYDVTTSQPKQRPLNLVVPMDGERAVAHEQAASDEGVAQGKSPTETAADAVTARLQALFPDPVPAPSAEDALRLPDPPTPFADLAPPAPEPAPVVVEPPPLVEPVAAEPAAAAEPAPAVDFVLTPAPEIDPPVEQPVEPAAVTLPAMDRPDQPTLFAPSAPLTAPPVADDGAAVARAARANFATWVDYTANEPNRQAPPVDLPPVEVDAGHFTDPATKSAILRFIPFAGLVLVGLVVFGGGLFWTLTADRVMGGAVAVVGMAVAVVGLYFFLQQIGSDADD